MCPQCGIPVDITVNHSEFVKIASQIYHLDCYLEGRLSINHGHVLSIRITRRLGRIELVEDSEILLALPADLAGAVGRDLVLAALGVQDGVAPAQRMVLEQLVP